MLYLGALFLAKVLDNALSTTKTILIQRSRWVLAGIAVILSDFIYFWITKRIVSADSMLALLVVAIAGGVGCSLACLVSDQLSKDRTYVNVIMSDNLEAMQAFRISWRSTTSPMWLPTPIRWTGTPKPSPLPLIPKPRPRVG